MISVRKPSLKSLSMFFENVFSKVMEVTELNLKDLLVFGSRFPSNSVGISREKNFVKYANRA